jgi:hypothetical protein
MHARAERANSRFATLKARNDHLRGAPRRELGFGEMGESSLISSGSVMATLMVMRAPPTT